MAFADIDSRQAVLDAVAEFDRIGRDQFLKTYGYREAQQYFLEINGRRYDSKAIVGVAHKYQFPTEGPLTPKQFSGGKTTVKAKLEGLGFRVVQTGEPTPIDDETNSETICLVSCVSEKRDRRSPARCLYTSQWFRKARAYVEAANLSWYVLSAKHGLLHPEAVIDPYEETLNTMPVAERRQWANSVLRQLEQTVPNVKRVIFLAGERYREFLADALVNRGIEVEVPMVGLAIGEQLAWLGSHVPK
jgi:hypothetical protein